MHEVQESGMGVQGIARADPPRHRQGRQQHFGDGNFVGLLIDPDLEQGLLALVGAKGQQMRRGVVLRGGTAHRFAIKGNWLIGGSTASLP